jgi:hypothetical protein
MCPKTPCRRIAKNLVDSSNRQLAERGKGVKSQEPEKRRACPPLFWLLTLYSLLFALPCLMPMPSALSPNRLCTGKTATSGPRLWACPLPRDKERDHDYGRSKPPIQRVRPSHVPTAPRPNFEIHFQPSNVILGRHVMTAETKSRGYRVSPREGRGIHIW